MILLCYDGSVHADAAVDHAAALMPGTATTVLTVWAPFYSSLTYGAALGIGLGDVAVDENPKLDAALHHTAKETADAGAARAAAAGLDATAGTRERRGSVAQTILEAATELEAGAVIVGARGLGDVRSFVVGSVTHELLQHAAVPVLVVPSADLGAHRRHLLSRG
jgi:nucleotide-binding universal stress UspA family protein